MSTWLCVVRIISAATVCDVLFRLDIEICMNKCSNVCICQDLLHIRPKGIYSNTAIYGISTGIFMKYVPSVSLSNLLLSWISYPEEEDRFRLWISRMLRAVYGLVWPGLHLWLGQSQAWPGGHTPMLSDHLLLLSSHPAQLPPGASGDKSWSQPLLRSWDPMSSDDRDKWVRQPRQWGDREHEIRIIVRVCDHEIIITPVTFSDQDECYHARGQ